MLIGKYKMKLLINTSLAVFVSLQSLCNVTDSVQSNQNSVKLENKIEYLKKNISIANDSIYRLIKQANKQSVKEKSEYGIFWSTYFTGRYFQLKFNLDSAYHYYIKVWDKIKHKPEYLDLIHLTTIGLANIYWDTGDYSSGLAILLETKNIFEKQNVLVKKHEIFNYLALFYEGILDYNNALENFQKAAAIALQQQDEGYAGIIIANTGRIFYKQKDFNTALDYYKKGVDLEIKNQLYRNAGRSYASIGTVYLDLNQIDSAKVYIEKAYENNRLANDSSGMVRTKIADSKYHTASKDYNKAIEILVSAIPIATHFNNKNELVEIHMLLAQNYFETGNYLESSKSYKNYILKYQSIYDIKKINQVNVLEHQLKITNQQNEINLLKIQRQKTFSKFLIVIAFLAIFLSISLIFFVVFYKKHNKKLKIQNKQITEQKEILEELNKKLILAEENANKADVLRSNFLSSLSHEIRTPLNGIVGFSSLVIDEEISEEEKTEVSRIIKKNSEELISTIEGLVDLSLMNSNQLFVYKETFDIYDFMLKIQNDVNNIRESLSKGNLQIKYTPDKTYKALTVFSDALLIKKILLKLIHNSLKFTVKGKVEYGFEVNGARIIFFVYDSGIGIPEDSQKNIFTAFEKGSNLPKNAGGLGISLSLSKKYVELLGGRIWFESLQHKGTRFKFEIPV